MLENIPWNFVADGGFSAIVMFTIWAILTGRLVPKSTHDDVRAQRDEWRTAALEAVQQNTKLLESARISDATFMALQEVARKEML